jgi:alpha-D-ribose 1-methylphosphonate 5-triphosphate diphosphatase PhnM
MEQKTPKRRGRKPINIDYAQVEHLASLNLGIMSICRSIGVGWDTFDKHRKKKSSELSEALERGKAKGLQRATSKLMEKIEDGEFQAIQFYLKSADREKWAERQEVNHTLNLAHILQDAQARIIELPRAEAPHAPKVKRLENIKGKG